MPPGEPDVPSFLPEQRLDLRAALDALTMGSAYVDHRDAVTAPGAAELADIALVDRDLFAHRDGLSAARVVLTLVDGRPLYPDPGIW